MPKVSVIILNYNHTHLISAAIQSALEQTYRSFEVIVVNDGSADNSREVVAGFGGQVRYIWQENQGLGVCAIPASSPSKRKFTNLPDTSQA